MMRSWPLEVFKNDTYAKRVVWNSPLIESNCQDCGEKASLWVETMTPEWPSGHTTRYYSKLCEPCFALRVLGDNEKTK
jgi:hypothetical protein